MRRPDFLFVEGVLPTAPPHDGWMMQVLTNSALAQMAQGKAAKPRDRTSDRRTTALQVLLRNYEQNKQAQALLQGVAGLYVKV